MAQARDLAPLVNDFIRSPPATRPPRCARPTLAMRFRDAIHRGLDGGGQAGRSNKLLRGARRSVQTIAETSWILLERYKHHLTLVVLSSRVGRSLEASNI